MAISDDALEYHRRGRPGKIEVVATKSTHSQRDLSLAYTPGVAAPCRAIESDPLKAFEYTARGNLVAVITNGTAVLGLGNIGPLAGKPVMEGKGVLFKRFADIDVFDLELNTQDPAEFIQIVKALEPTFGGINLEDIAAPACFEIEERLKEALDIPVFHDDQHGTAIISGAGLLNAAELAGKKLEDLRVVVCGAGAAGIACAKFYISLGVRPENLLMTDSKGVLHTGRAEGMNPYKAEFVRDTEARTLADAMHGADVFAGVSGPGLVTPDMVRSMADNPIIFAMANPDPEIMYDEALAVRNDIIMATGRSDFPNQVNNVLGFPFIFRGALDVRARAINEDMKVAAAQALAELAKEPVPYQVMMAYRLDNLKFGREYIIPKPFDPRVLIWESAAVAKAAMDSGVARVMLDIDEYRERLEARLGFSRRVMRVVIKKARKAPKRIVYPEGEHAPILKACETILDEGMAQPILLGNRGRIDALIDELRLNLKGGVTIVDPEGDAHFDEYVEALYQLRQRKGVGRDQARLLMAQPNYFGSMMVRQGHADGLVSGLTSQYPDTIRPALQVIGPKPGVRRVAGMYMMVLRDRILFFGDTTVNVEPTAEDLAEIALLCAEGARRFDVEPRIAMVSFSNFGSARYPASERVHRAVERIRELAPGLTVDGEMQADTAVTPDILREDYPFSPLQDGANVLIFPNLDAGNAAYKLVKRLGDAEVVGPILLGMRKPVHLLQRGDFDERDVINMTAVAVVDAQQAVE